MVSNWRPDRPHDGLPTLPPERDLETKAVLKGCIAARSALAELKRAIELIPNPQMLVNTLPVLEAKASSEIENIVTTTDALFRQLGSEGPADVATREASRYRSALLEGFGSLEQRPLSTRTAETVCTRIRGVDMTVRRVPGTALANASTGEVIYTPPATEARIRTLLSNWERFLHAQDDLDPLVRMAAAHYQFEAIHPFTDGNGRTGRVLNSLFLVSMDLLPLPILYLSRYVISRKTEYYDLLLGVTARGEWEPWLLYMLRGVAETSAWTTAKIGAIHDLSEETAGFVRARLPKLYSRELIDVLFEQPYSRIANVVDAGIVGRQAASRYLQALVAIGVLEDERVGRERLFIHRRLLGLLAADDHDYERLEASIAEDM